MKSIQFIALAATISIFSVACSDKKPTENSQQTTEVVKAPTVAEQVSVLSNSVDSAWQSAILLDSQKFANIKRLIEEISYCKKYDEKGVAKALKLTSEIKSFQYTQENLSDSTITVYDTKTDELIRFVRNLKSNTAEITQHPLADQLENEITEADGLLVNYRSNYDQAAIKYNSFLELNKEAIGVKKRLFSVPA